MKLNVKYMIAAFALLGLVGCDKNFEEFETSGGGSPAAVELSTVVISAALQVENIKDFPFTVLKPG